MSEYRISAAMRFFFLVSGSLMWLGIWLTGFDLVHWVLYIPAVTFWLAALTGLCIGMIVSRKLFPN